MSRDEDEFIDSIKQQLDQQTESLDDQTLLRLRKARVAAQSVSDARHWHWRPIAAVASVAVLAVAVWIASPVSHNGEESVAALDDLELLASSDDLELYEEIEFYQWLEAQDEQG